MNIESDFIHKDLIFFLFFFSILSQQFLWSVNNFIMIPELLFVFSAKK